MSDVEGVNVYKEKIFIKNILVDSERIQIHLQEFEFPALVQGDFVIFQKRGNKRWKQEMDLKQLQNGELNVDITTYLSEYFIAGTATWTIQLEARTIDQEYVYTFKTLEKFPKEKKKILADKRNQFLDVLGEKKMEGKEWFCQLYYSEFSTLSLRQREKSKLYTSQIEAKLTDIDIRKKTIIVEATMDDIGMEIEGMILRYRGEEEGDSKEIPFLCQVEKKGRKYLIHGELKLKEVTLESMMADAFLIIKDLNGYFYHIYIVNNDKNFMLKFQKLFHPLQYRVNKSSMFYPYISVYKNLGFAYQPIRLGNSIWFRLKERIAIKCYIPQKESLNKQNIMLLYEKDCESAQENGFFFFQYCMENDMESCMNRKIYFVINKKSPQYDNVKQYGKKVLNYLSVRHMMYLLSTKLFVSSETKVHSYEKVVNCSIIRPKLENKPTVFLQHGVIAFKKLPFLSKKNRNIYINQFITSSKIEQDIVVKYLDYNKEDVAITGLARWDLLEDKSEGSRDILFMPTWRNELEFASDEEFKSSVYFTTYMNLLNDERFNEVLEKYNLTFNFYMHPKLRKFMNCFSSNQSNVNLIAFGEVELNQLIMSTKVMITDYSSAVWDAYWLGKPVIFYQFDVEEYIKTHGSYFDLKTELFGDAVYDKEELLIKIEEMVEREFQEKEEYAKLRETYLPYRDHDNRKRICETILKAGL